MLRPAFNRTGRARGLLNARVFENLTFFGGCPHCFGEDGYYNLRRAHWFVCATCKCKWLRGEKARPVAN